MTAYSLTAERQFRENLMVQVAMWADEHLFGHGLDDDAYEEECERLTDHIYDEVYSTLRDRDPR